MTYPLPTHPKGEAYAIGLVSQFKSKPIPYAYLKCYYPVEPTEVDTSYPNKGKMLVGSSCKVTGGTKNKPGHGDEGYETTYNCKPNGSCNVICSK